MWQHFDFLDEKDAQQDFEKVGSDSSGAEDDARLAIKQGAEIMEVIGGESKGGIIARSGRDTASQSLGRLSTGALVAVEEQDGMRLKYRLLIGAGPKSGWVTASANGKELLVRTTKQTKQEQIVVAKDKKTPREEVPADSDGEDIIVCTHCRLPLGDSVYASKGCKKDHVHGECMAQLMLLDLRQKDEIRMQKDAATKQARRMEFEIGWKVERIPSNLGPLGKLQCQLPQDALVCLVFDENTKSVSLATTTEPSAAVNLEYLSLALQCRRKEGREPWFSLDPLREDKFSDGLMQVKNFKPTWLAGTSLGEVLFQADYHLKELSMGEHEQPVVGMKSCFDLSKDEKKGWNAREWFTVRKAEIMVSEDNKLIPFVKMGVEAREQIEGENGLEDAPITRADHPLVKYAADFSKNFDLIAERKSVIHQMREVAKASIMAKFLLEAEVDLKEEWFNLAGEAKEEMNFVIPQLWNDCCTGKIQLQDGKIANAEKGIETSMHGIYGGVDFGLTRFDLGEARPDYSARLARRPRPVGPGGVDLGLDNFRLDAVVKTTTQAFQGTWGAGNAPTGEAFWACIEKGAASAIKDDDKSLLRSIFNESFSDRREEGNNFVPPDVSFTYANHLRSLVKEEKKAQDAMTRHFLSSDFTMDNVGPLFPSKWVSTIDIETPLSGKVLDARPDFKQRAHVLEPVLRSATPVFDKASEDGTRFRIYQLGSLEVRTTQAYDGAEVIGAVLSSRTPEAIPTEVLDRERIVKVVEYVERDQQTTSAATLYRRYYVVYDTDLGNSIVTEKLRDGTVTWEENPKNLNDRNSLAKVCRSAECAGSTVRDAKARQAREARRIGAAASRSKCKMYAREAYAVVLGNGASAKPASSFRVILQEPSKVQGAQARERNVFSGLFSSKDF